MMAGVLSKQSHLPVVVHTDVVGVGDFKIDLWFWLGRRSTCIPHLFFFLSRFLFRCSLLSFLSYAFSLIGWLWCFGRWLFRFFLGFRGIRRYRFFFECRCRFQFAFGHWCIFGGIFRLVHRRGRRHRCFRRRLLRSEQRHLGHLMRTQPISLCFHALHVDDIRKGLLYTFGCAVFAFKDIHLYHGTCPVGDQDELRSWLIIDD